MYNHIDLLLQSEIDYRRERLGARAIGRKDRSKRFPRVRRVASTDDLR